MFETAAPARPAWRATLPLTILLVLGLLLGSGALLGGDLSAAARRGPAASRPALADLGPTAPAQRIAFSLVLAGQAPTRLAATVAAISDPRSPRYQHYLTPEAFARQFGPSAAARTTVEDALRVAGITVAGEPSGTLLRASATAAQLERLFGVRFETYRARDGSTFYSATAAPRLPAALRGLVTGVLGLDDRVVARHTVLHAPRPLQGPRAARASAPANNGFGPADLAAAYDLTPLTQAGLDGTGQSIALAEIDTFKQQDINAYDQAFGITAPPVQVVTVGPGAQSGGDGSETTLDIEVIHAVAPKTTIIAYEGGATFQGLASTFNKIVTDNRAHVVSISLGICEQYIAHPETAPSDLQGAFDESGTSFLSALDSTFQQADAQGMSVFVSSGDSGAYGCSRFDPSNHTLSASVPASSPYVTAVGGTALFLGTSGGYGREAGWESPLEGAGGGGGVSIAYPRPSWQKGPGTDNQYSNGRREVPDVSADADPLTGYAVYDSTSGCTGSACWQIVGGTSAAAPLWAGLITLANQQLAAKRAAPLGFLDPALYGLAQSSTGGAAFHDVSLGGNLYYPATQGWDYSTGLGTPDGSAVVSGLEKSAQPAG